MLEAYFPDTKVQYKIFEPPTRPQLYFIKHDWEIGGFLRSPSNAPEVHELGHYTRLTKDWQFFWYRLNNPVGFTEAKWKQAWKSYTAGGPVETPAFITDDRGSDTRTDYVSGVMRNEDMEIECLFCGGNVITGREWKDSKGVWWLTPEYLDAFNPPPVGMTYETHPWFIHHAVNVAGKVGFQKANPFPQFGGRNTGLPIYHPFMGNKNKLTMYRLDWLRKLSQDEPIPNPYQPAM